ncbi:MAG: DUF1844 domain-containing protein [Planctomycetes bacterium]|nr:DUF1844 domain-containing protein [Planctomycetota bacterium]
MNDNGKEQNAPKIHIDDDWKAQAKAEKDRMAAEQQDKQPPGGNAGGARGGKRPSLPPATFETLVSTMASQALFALGAVPDPNTQKAYVDLELARFHIDMLKVLEEKSAGNLTEDEKQLLDATLYELRSHYVAISRRAGGVV